jgi:hypothetical protein
VRWSEQTNDNRIHGARRFQQQLDIWEAEYLNKPYEMVANGYPRPPIKNVYMVYGVNWPTPVSERYSIRAGHPEPQIAEQRVETAGGVIRDKKTWRAAGGNVRAWAKTRKHNGTEQSGRVGRGSWRLKYFFFLAQACTVPCTCVYFGLG